MPFAGSKELKFEKHLAHTGFDFLDNPKKGNFWELAQVNGKKVLEISKINQEQYPKACVRFFIKKKILSKHVYLDTLFPSFPKITGVDLFQFLMSLSYVCEMKLSVTDDTDLSTPYKKLYGVRYYTSLVKGTKKNLPSQGTEINKDTFLECANKQVRTDLDFAQSNLKENILAYRTEKIKSDKRLYDNFALIDYQDCPVVSWWITVILNKWIIRLCTGINNSVVWAEDFSFNVKVEDINRIMNKVMPKSPASYEDQCTEKIIPKSYDEIIEDGKTEKFLKNHLYFVIQCYKRNLERKLLSCIYLKLSIVVSLQQWIFVINILVVINNYWYKTNNPPPPPSFLERVFDEVGWFFYI